MANEITTGKVELGNGETLFYREAGTGDTVLVLLHGNMNSSLNWDLLMEELPSDKFRMIAPDHRGMGESTYKNEVKNMKDFSEDLKLFADKLGLTKFILMGWSFGGAVAEQFTADHQDMVEKLILLSASSIQGYPLPKTRNGKVVTSLFTKKIKYIKSKDDLQEVLAGMIYTIDSKNYPVLKSISDASLYAYNKPDDARYDAYVKEMGKQRNLLDLDYALMRFNISHEHNGVTAGTGEVDKITCPVLILQGDKDLTVRMPMAEYNRDAFGDRAKFVVVENAGHVILVDNMPKLKEELLAFIG